MNLDHLLTHITDDFNDVAFFFAIVAFCAVIVATHIALETLHNYRRDARLRKWIKDNWGDDS